MQEGKREFLPQLDEEFQILILENTNHPYHREENIY